MAKTLRKWLEEEPFTLALSSSFFGFYAHCGVAESLFTTGLRPRRITGASAGALVGGALSSGLTPKEARDLLFGVRKSDFWDPYPGLGLLRGKKFLRILEKNYAPSFDRAVIPFESTVFDMVGMKTRFLSTGPLPKAVVASCAVPLLFHPVRIGAHLYLDGGVFHKSGIHLEHPEERTLSVFLLNDGLADSYELGKSLGKLGPQQKVLRIKDLPQLNYNSLERGPLAYEAALKRTKAALEMALETPILDG
jgi:NTE family protein